MIERYTPMETSWDPFGEVNELRRAVNRLFGAGNGLGQEAFPPLNIYANGNEAIIAVEIPGVQKENLEISVSGGTFTLAGSREPGELSEDCRPLRRERFQGSFRRAVELPFNVEGDKVKAKLQNGILHVRLPRAESDKPRKIQVEG